MIDDEEEWYSNTVQSQNCSIERAYRVQGITLDDLIASQGLERIDFLKMNIEGSEVEALKGLRTWAGRVKHLCVACHDFRADRGESESYRTRAAVMDNLNALGFALVMRDGDARPFVRDHIHAYREVPDTSRDS
jgi:hypothetical protein